MSLKNFLCVFIPSENIMPSMHLYRMEWYQGKELQREAKESK
jgi:hypothetical protein